LWLLGPHDAQGQIRAFVAFGFKEVDSKRPEQKPEQKARTMPPVSFSANSGKKVIVFG
jgi:hypothetical protein